MSGFKAIETTITMRGFTTPEAVVLYGEGNGHLIATPLRRGASADLCFSISDGETTTKMTVDLPLTCYQIELLESVWEQAQKRFIAESKLKWHLS